MPSPLIENRQIRVFISSTFQDMQAERDELMKKTFPILRQKAAARDVTLTELDLRWGITEEEAKSGKVVEICLREIENSIPFFIGIIGNRYGWIPSKKDIGENVTNRFKDVNDYINQGLSVTEMEMQFGVLNRKDTDMHAYFYIKEQEEQQDYPEMLAKLKEQVQHSQYPSSSYKSIEDLAQQVEVDFTQLLDKLFPEGNLSELEKERISQRSYRNGLCHNYIKDDANYVVINRWMEDWDKHQLVITGASGLGKSALIANWIKEQEQQTSLPYKIIYHFVGNGGSLGSHGHVMDILCQEIRDRYGWVKEDNESNQADKELENLFLRVAAEGDQPLVLVLDAINQIVDADNAKLLNWLPIPPKKVKILFTTLPNDTTMEVFKNRHYPIFTLQPLNTERRRMLVTSYLHLFAKALTPNQVDRIITDTQCENTLVLKTLLDELVNYGIYEKLDEKIDYYLHTETIEEFYQTLLLSYENDFSCYGKDFVNHLLSLIVVSRNGLSEDEILSITKISPLHWSQFYCSFRAHLVVRNGLIAFGHSYISSAVHERYIAHHPKYEKNYRKEIINLFQGQNSHRAWDELPWQYYLVKDTENLYNFLMNLEVFEYIYHNDKNNLIKWWNALISRGKSMEGYIALTQENDCINIAYHLCFFLNNYIVDLLLEEKLVMWLLKHNISNKEEAYLYNYVGSFFSRKGNHQKALEYQEKALSIRLDIFGENHPDVVLSYNDVGVEYGELGDHQKALEYQEKALAIRLDIFGENHPDVTNSYNNVGSEYGDLGNHQQALEYLEKALAINLVIFGDHHPDVAISYNNVGHEYGELGNHQKALEYAEKALAIRLDIFGENHPDVAQSYNNVGCEYGDLGNHQKALEYQEKALSISLVIFGENHPDVATEYDNVGYEYGALGNHQKALENQEKALSIRLDIFGENHPDIALSYNNVGYEYGELGNHQKALEYKEKALSISLVIFGENHPDVATEYNNVGLEYGALGNHQKALEYKEKALAIRLDIFGENHPTVANSYNNVGYEYGELGNHQKALEYKEKSLTIRLAIFGENHPVVAQSYNNVGVEYGALGNHQKALEYKEKALAIRLGIFGENHPAVATSYNNVGGIYGELGNHQKALEYAEKALAIRLDIFGENHPDVASSYNNVGCEYGDLGNHQQALEYIGKALEIAQLNNYDNLVPIFHNRLARTYEAAGNIPCAIEQYQKAADIFTEQEDQQNAEENRTKAAELQKQLQSSNEK